MTWIVDAHCHLSDGAYDDVRAEVLEKLTQAGVLAVINPASDEESSKQAMRLALENSQVFACAGTHPEEADSYSSSAEYLYRTMAANHQLVAIGEIGLDYHYLTSPRDRQKEVLVRQLRLAHELDLPVVIHCREAVDDLIPILLEEGPGLRILLHCFNEPLEKWEVLQSLDPYISIGGMVTFKNAPYPKALAQAVPSDRLLVETDGPYLAPVPKRGRLNMPWYAWYSLEEVARLRGVACTQLADQTVENTARFYGLEDVFAKLRKMKETNFVLSESLPFAKENYTFSEE